VSWQLGRFWHGALWLVLTSAVLAIAPVARAQVTLPPGTINYTYQVTTEQFSPGSTTRNAHHHHDRQPARELRRNGRQQRHK
jgi:hypothetical protein